MKIILLLILIGTLAALHHFGPGEPTAEPETTPAG
jgi:hypothetical protein